MQEFYIGQKFHYYFGNKVVAAKLIKIDGDTLYFRNSKGQSFKGSKYFVGHTIFIDTKPSETEDSTKKKKTKKQYSDNGIRRDHRNYKRRDRSKRLDTYWDNIGKPGTQKGID